MFGYIQPMECELKVREQALYRAAYCGLCRAIGGRYGQAARMALNYDCAFLGLFLETLSEEGVRLEKQRCLLRPTKGKQPMVEPGPALCYAADVNVLLTAYQQKDRWADEKKPSALAASAALKGSFERAKRHRPELAQKIRDGLAALGELEENRCDQVDLPACAFGEILRDVALGYPLLPEGEREAVSWMFFNLGRWIYLMDAWEDREKDGALGSYNPFLLARTSREDAAFQLQVSLTEAEKAFDLITFPNDPGVLNNIMHLGCRFRTRRLLGEEDRGECA